MMQADNGKECSCTGPFESCSYCTIQQLRAALREALDLTHDGKTQTEWDRIAALRKLCEP